MLDDLYSSQNEAIVNDLIARPPAAKQAPTKFNAWKFATAAPRGVAVGATEAAGSSADILGAFGQIMAATDSRSAMFASQTEAERQAEEKATSALRETGPVFDAGDQFRRAAKQFMPDPQSAHTSETLVFGLGRFATKAVGYTAMGGPVVGAGLTGVDEGLTAAQELKDQGVDINTRTAVGAVSGVAGAAGVLMPVAGKNIAQTAALVATGGPGTFMAQQATTRKILQDAGYDQIGMQYDPMDPVGLAVSTLVPAGFGAFALRGAKIRERASTEASARMEAAIASDRASAEIGPPKPTPEQVDAARVEMLSQHMESSGLYKPEDARAAAMHVEAYAKAMEDLSAGRRVDVTDLVPVERIEVAKALDTFTAGLESARSELLSQAALRAEPGVIRQMQSELADHQTALSQLEDPQVIKERAKELQQSDRISYKQALTQATKEFGAQADDIKSRITRIESMMEDNAQGQQAFDALNKMDQQAEQIRLQRAAIDAPSARKTPVAAAAREAIQQPTMASKEQPANAVPQQTGQSEPINGMAGSAPLIKEPAAQPARSDAGSVGPTAEPVQGGGSSSGSPAAVAETGLVAQRLADIQAQFPDLTVQMDGMDKPVRLADFLAEIQREAMEGTDFELGANDAPLMQVAASCFLLNG